MIVLASSKPYALAMLQEAFAAYAPPKSFCLPDSPQAAQADTAACWFPDTGYLKNLPNLKLIHSMGAGVEHLGAELLSGSLPICRVIDESHKQGMLEYVLWAVLYYQRHFDYARHHQIRGEWQQYPRQNAAQTRIGILGLGQMGAYVAEALSRTGYSVSGWSRGPKQLPGVTTHYGTEGLAQLLPQTDILVNLLPLTDDTRRILNRDLFCRLPTGAALIQCGRGGHLNTADLLEALSNGKLRGAVLDVFDHEPLPANDILWRTPGVVLTPHIASHAPLETVVAQILDNAARLRNGLPLLNEIDKQRGY